MNSFVRLLTLLMILGLTGCPQPLPDRHLKSELDYDDLIGTWGLTAASLQNVKHDGFETKPEHKNSISFNDDGTFVYQTILPEFRGGNYIDVSGSWKLRYDPERRGNYITIKLNVSGVIHERGISVSRDESGLVLWEYYGDPDELKYIEYRKSSN